MKHKISFSSHDISGTRKGVPYLSMNDPQINVSLHPRTPQKRAEKMCAADVYTVSPFLHIFMRRFIEARFPCKMCATDVYTMSHIFFTVNAGVNGDFPPAQIQAMGVRETLIWLRRGVKAAPTWQRSRNKKHTQNSP